MSDDIGGMATTELSDVLRGLTEQLMDRTTPRSDLERATLNTLRIQIVGELSNRTEQAVQAATASKRESQSEETRREIALLQAIANSDETPDTLKKIHRDRIADLQRSIGDEITGMGATESNAGARSSDAAV